MRLYHIKALAIINNEKYCTVVADNPNFKSLDGVLYSKDSKNLIAYPSAKSGEYFVVPEGAEEIRRLFFELVYDDQSRFAFNVVQNRD